MAGKNQSSAGPQSWAFMPTGPSVQATIAASSLTLTLSQFVSTAPYAPQCAFWNLGAAATNSAAFAAFGSTITVSTTTGVPIVPVTLMGTAAAGSVDSGLQILSTGKSNVCVIGTPGTTTLWLTPGEGSR